MDKLSESKLYEYTNNESGITIETYLGFEKNIVVPNEIDGISVSRIGDKAFLNCKELQLISLPNTINEIGKEAFKGCNRLKEIFLPESLNIISEYAFSECSNLVFLELPKEVIEIGQGAFDNSGLNGIIVYDSVEKIGDDCFNGCNFLKIFCNAGSYVLKYARHNGIAVDQIGDENNWKVILIQTARDWNNIVNYFEDTDKYLLGKCKPVIQDDKLVIYTEDELSYVCVEGNLGKIRNLFMSYVGRYFKVIVETNKEI